MPTVRFFLVLLAGLATLGLAACHTAPPAGSIAATAAPKAAPNAAPPAVDKPSGPLMTFAAARATPAEREACTKAGGRVDMGGLLGRERCTRLFSDAGQPCTDSAQCQGQCRATQGGGVPGKDPKGQCTATDSPFGCYSVVANGQPTGMLCVD